MYSSLAGHSGCREGKAALFPFAHGRIKLERTYIQQVKMFEEGEMRHKARRRLCN